MKVRDFVKMLEEDGWYLARHGKGDHNIYEHDTKKGHVSVDGAPGHDIPIGTLQRMLRTAGLK